MTNPANRIHLASAIAREGRILLLRPTPRSPWELPGGSLQPEHADTESAMDEILASFGIDAPAIEEDFLETIYLPEAEGYTVYNVYLPTDWTGEPRIPIGMGSGWFAPEELEAIEMDVRVRESLLAAFGLREPTNREGAILAALEGLATGSPHAPGSREPEPGPAKAGAIPPAAGVPPQPANAAQRPEAEAGDTPAPPSARHEAGLDVLRTLGGGGDPTLGLARLERANPELAGDIVDFALGEVWANPILDRKVRSLEVVAMLSALGGREGALRSHLNGALNHGASPEEIVQTLRMVAVYAGFPAALAAWDVMEEVFAARHIPRPGRTP